jgi:hypothetical protein
MESLQKTERPMSPEEFFATIDVRVASNAEMFLVMVKKFLPKIPDGEILAAQAMNFKRDGKVKIILRSDVRPDEYMPYLLTHEEWEAYVTEKSGYNLLEKSRKDYLQAHPEDQSNFYISAGFRDEFTKYNFDFRHEYAIYKEYEQAMYDGKLDEYHKWFMDLRNKEKITASGKTLERLENDMAIRESVYKKLTQESKHFFLKK